MEITIAGHRVQLRWPSDVPDADVVDAATGGEQHGVVTIQGVLVSMELPQDQLSRFKYISRYVGSMELALDYAWHYEKMAFSAKLFATLPPTQKALSILPHFVKTRTEIITYDPVRLVYTCSWWAPVEWVRRYTERLDNASIAALVPLQPIHDALARLL